MKTTGFLPIAFEHLGHQLNAGRIRLGSLHDIDEGNDLGRGVPVGNKHLSGTGRFNEVEDIHERRVAREQGPGRAQCVQAGKSVYLRLLVLGHGLEGKIGIFGRFLEGRGIRYPA